MVLRKISKFWVDQALGLSESKRPQPSRVMEEVPGWVEKLGNWCWLGQFQVENAEFFFRLPDFSGFKVWLHCKYSNFHTLYIQYNPIIVLLTSPCPYLRYRGPLLKHDHL